MGVSENAVDVQFRAIPNGIMMNQLLCFCMYPIFLHSFLLRYIAHHVAQMYMTLDSSLIYHYLFDIQ